MSLIKEINEAVKVLSKDEVNELYEIILTRMQHARSQEEYEDAEEQLHDLMNKYPQWLKEEVEMKLEELNEGIKIPSAWFAAFKQRVEKDDLTDDDYEMLYDFVIDHDPSWMPYGTMKARTGDPYNWIADHLDEIVAAMKKYVK